MDPVSAVDIPSDEDDDENADASPSVTLRKGGSSSTFPSDVIVLIDSTPQRPHVGSLFQCSTPSVVPETPLSDTIEDSVVKPPILSAPFFSVCSKLRSHTPLSKCSGFGAAICLDSDNESEGGSQPMTLKENKTSVAVHCVKEHSDINHVVHNSGNSHVSSSEEKHSSPCLIAKHGYLGSDDEHEVQNCFETPIVLEKSASFAKSKFSDKCSDYKVSESVLLNANEESIANSFGESGSQIFPIDADCVQILDSPLHGYPSPHGAPLSPQVDGPLGESEIATKELVSGPTGKGKKIVGVDNDRGARKRQLKEEKLRLREEKRLKREQTKLQKEALKAQAIEDRKLQKERGKWEKGKFALKSIVAEIDAKVIEKGSIGGYLLSRFAEKGLTFRITSNPIESSILWKLDVPDQVAKVTCTVKGCGSVCWFLMLLCTKAFLYLFL
ncbi:hypothetical protein AMTRI_Chr13g89080 [Amborella trichopoda]